MDNISLHLLAIIILSICGGLLGWLLEKIYHINGLKIFYIFSSIISGLLCILSLYTASINDGIGLYSIILIIIYIFAFIYSIKGINKINSAKMDNNVQNGIQENKNNVVHHTIPSSIGCLAPFLLITGFVCLFLGSSLFKGSPASADIIRIYIIGGIMIGCIIMASIKSLFDSKMLILFGIIYIVIGGLHLFYKTEKTAIRGGIDGDYFMFPGIALVLGGLIGWFRNKSIESKKQ